MRFAAASLALLPLFTSPAVGGSLNLYEWLATAPVILTGENLLTYGKYTEFRVESVLRGQCEPGSVIRVNVRRANRDRNRYVDRLALRFDKGLSYVLLLTPVATRRRDAPPTYEFVRGVRGAREVPVEGGDPFLDAVEQFVEIQERNDDGYTWRRLTEMVEETNPLLVETSLELFIKFRRGNSRLLGSLRPLLDHPSELLRERSATLIGQILEHDTAEPLPDVALLRSELVAKARRDRAVTVRVAATRALSGLGGEAVLEILGEIAREDPDQDVRYAAQRLLYDRRNDEHGDGSGEGN